MAREEAYLEIARLHSSEVSETRCISQDSPEKYILCILNSRMAAKRHDLAGEAVMPLAGKEYDQTMAGGGGNKIFIACGNQQWGRSQARSGKYFKRWRKREKKNFAPAN